MLKVEGEHLHISLEGKNESRHKNNIKYNTVFNNFIFIDPKISNSFLVHFKLPRTIRYFKCDYNFTYMI